jgi:hypothetical protein
LWLYQKLFFPDNFNETIKNFINDKSKQFFVIPIGIELSNGAHANILLYDKTTNELERFEPFGKDFPPNFNYQNKLLDEQLYNYFMNFFPDMKYFSPLDYQDKIGPQLVDTYEMKKNKNIGDPGGFCAAWCLWYIDNRIKNISIDRKLLIGKLINNAKLKNILLRQIIRNYSKNITDIRDNYLLKVDININDWLNDNFSKDQFDKLINIIKKDIN